MFGLAPTPFTQTAAPTKKKLFKLKLILTVF